MEPFIRCFCILLTVLLSCLIWSFLPPIDNSIPIAALYVLVFFLSIWLCYYKLANLILSEPDKPINRSESNPTQIIRNAEKQLLSLLQAMLSLSDSQSESLHEFIIMFSEAVRTSKQMSLEDIDSFIDWIFLNGYIKSPVFLYQELGLKITTTCKIYIPPEIRAQIDWTSERKRSLENGILLTACNTAPNIASWNSELASFLEGLFYKTDDDLLSILDRILELAEEACDEIVSLPGYIIRLAEIPHFSELDYVQATSNQIEAYLRILAKSLLINIEPDPQEKLARFNRSIRCTKRLKILREQHVQRLISEELLDIKKSIKLNR